MDPALVGQGKRKSNGKALLEEEASSSDDDEPEE